MSRRIKKKALPFDKRGGVVAIRLPLLNSEAYETMTLHARYLLVLMHKQWRNDRPVDYGVREAERKIGCAFNTALKAFRQLQERGFIVMAEESEFNSRTTSKARSWRLTWMPFMDKSPTNDWEKWRAEN